MSLKLILHVVNHVTLLPLPLRHFSYAVNLVSGSLTFCRINIFCSCFIHDFNLISRSWHFNYITIIGNVSNLQTIFRDPMSPVPPITSDFPPGYIRWTNLAFIVGPWIACARERYGFWLGWWLRPRSPHPTPTWRPTKENILAIRKQPGSGGVAGLGNHPGLQCKILEYLVFNHL